MKRREFLNAAFYFIYLTLAAKPKVKARAQTHLTGGVATKVTAPNVFIWLKKIKIENEPQK